MPFGGGFGIKKRSKVTHQNVSSAADELHDSKHDGKLSLKAILKLFQIIITHKYVPKSKPFSILLLIALKTSNYEVFSLTYRLHYLNFLFTTGVNLSSYSTVRQALDPKRPLLYEDRVFLFDFLVMRTSLQFSFSCCSVKERPMY